MKVSHFPLRVAIGAFFLNSGLSKRSLEGQAAEGVHGMAVVAAPALNRFRPRTFARLLAGAETALGAALLLPMVPSALVGAGLCGFAGGLMRLYWVTPGMHESGSPRPTQQGVPLAKDAWLVGAGLTLVLDDLIGSPRGLTGRGVTGRGAAGRGAARRGLTGRGLTGRGLTGRGLTGRGLTRRGHAGHGAGGRGVPGHGLVAHRRGGERA